MTTTATPIVHKGGEWLLEDPEASYCYVADGANSQQKEIIAQLLYRRNKETGKLESMAISIDEIASFDEVAACGTATVCVPIASVTNGSEKLEFGKFEILNDLRNELMAIQLGDAEDKHGWMREVRRRPRATRPHGLPRVSLPLVHTSCLRGTRGMLLQPQARSHSSSCPRGKAGPRSPPLGSTHRPRMGGSPSDSAEAETSLQRRECMREQIRQR